MAALDAALALAQAHYVAVLVGQHLELDVPRPLDELLHVQIAVAERGCRLRPCRVKLIGHLVSATDNPHAAPPTPRRSFHDHWEADAARPFLRLNRRENDAGGPRQN